jgi:hypothetical protein
MGRIRLLSPIQAAFAQCRACLLPAGFGNLTRDRNNPRLLSKQPCDRDLGRRCLLLGGNFAEQANQRLIRFSGLRREAGDDVAEIGSVELGVFADRAREESLPQRTEWDKADPKLLKRRQNLLLRLSPPQRILALGA